MRSLNLIKDLPHAVLKIFDPKNTVKPATIGHQRRQVIRNRRPVNIGRHRAVPLHGIACKQQKPPERSDLIKDLFSIRAANLDPIVFDQKRHERFAVATATSLDPANFIKKRR